VTPIFQYVYLFFLTAVLGRYSYRWRHHLTITIDRILGPNSVRHYHYYALNLTYFRFKYLGDFRPSFWHSDQSWSSLLETPLSPLEFCSVVDLHPPGSFHPRHNGCFLQECHRASSTVCFISVLFIYLHYSFEPSG